MITPFRKPAGGELLDWQKEYNTQVNKIRWMIEQVVSHFKNWIVMHTDYRRQGDPQSRFRMSAEVPGRWHSLGAVVGVRREPAGFGYRP
jgi:hypothetical protein